MITITLPNTDAPAIEVSGVLRFSGRANTADCKRHLHLAIYEEFKMDRESARRARLAPESSAYAFGLTYTSSWPHEVPHHLASLYSNLEELRKGLLNVDPSRWVSGHKFKPDVDAAIKSDVRNRWQELVVSAMDRIRATGGSQ